MCVCYAIIYCFLRFYLTCEQALQEQYGSDDVAKNGVDLLLATLSKIFDSLQEAYKGQLSYFL